MKRTLAMAAAAAIAAVLTAVLAAQGPVDPATLGPRVGEKAVAFTLLDQTGTPRELGALAGLNGTMLVFFRSSDW